MTPGHTALMRIPRGGIVDGRRAGETYHRMFAGNIGRLPGKSRDTTLRRGVDNRTTSLFEHLAYLITHAVPHAFQIDGHRAVKLLVGNLGHGPLRGLYAGIVVRGIQPAIGGHYPTYHLFYSLRIGDITAVGHGRVPRLHQPGCLVCRLVNIGHHYGSSSPGKSLGASQPYTGRCPGNQSDFSLHSFHTCS